ncbi:MULTISPECIES: MarR family winged helix-turn-helix transcriptional regulator [Alphaproteobacteria]|uniref:MarR family transcriptional regulator n=1 Tax=Maricaulis virginensis TaxID=144022 RepID=A0A9W6ILL0_9PROT|nr:MarR family transcriptional regulator [Maricaulis virginensis]MBQ96258.1 MarR family transcriptional regulator [Actinomycetota bacterium]GLK51754.1 MarR family transcriptional regulator [Maricaulis virginensis]|tara:strand:- start:4981 stop:5424 length:444 start_codon:yes stop_codon:yes gene_type:complete
MPNEKRDLSDETVTAWARLVRISQAVLSKVEADLKAADLPPLSWYDALLELERARPDGLRPYQLQERMLLAQYNMSRLTDRLAKAGYIEREDCSDDGRGQILKIDSAGRGLLQRMWPVYRKAIAAHFAEKLDTGETAALSRMLIKLR